MLLKQIAVKNFRNFINNIFYFNPFLTIILGKNSVGKTNLLEAIYFSSLGRGFREEKEEELINYGKEKAEVLTQMLKEKEKTELRIIIEKKNQGVIKTYFVNKIKKKAFQYLSESQPAVIFSPSLIEIIEGEPENRRKYFDKIIARFDWEYKRRLINFENGLRKRNKILEKEKEKEKLKEELEFWDDYLIDQGSYLTKKREELVNFLNQHSRLDKKIFIINYLKNELTEKALKETFEKQLILKKTLVGPQRDDFEILLKEESGFKNLQKFGSRGEQRLALFWLILNEVNLYQEKLKKKPIILLDDIFSELDKDNKSLVLRLIKKYQTVVTSSQPEILDLIEVPHSIIALS